MDSSHVSLCALQLRTEAFDHYRCDKALALGVNTENFAKLLKCSGNEDVVTLKSEEEGDMLTMTFEAPKQDRISEFALKLMDIESEHLGIPDTEYKCTVRMPSNEFQRIIRDLQVLGDTCTSALASCHPPPHHHLFLSFSRVLRPPPHPLIPPITLIGTISVTKEGICFYASGDLGTGKIMLKHNTATDKDEEAVVINMQEDVELNFALRYLTLFTKASSLGSSVILSMSKDIPILVEYPVDNVGSIRFYLAPSKLNNKSPQIYHIHVLHR